MKIAPSDRIKFTKIQSLLLASDEDRPIRIDRQSHEGMKEVPFELILPFGSNAAYSLNQDGAVDGVKFGGLRSNADEILSLVAEFSSLRRVVIFSNQPLDIPEAFATLDSLEMLWIGGRITKIPEKLFYRGLELHVAQPKADSLNLASVLSAEAYELTQRSSIKQAEDIITSILNREESISKSADYERLILEFLGLTQAGFS